MKRNRFILGVCFSVIFAFGLQSCSDDDDDDDDTLTEFVADDNSFANFTSWTLEATENGVDPSLGAAHSGDQENSVREIYFKDGQDASGGAYPVGTLIGKQVTSDDGSLAYFGMAKRGNGFSSSHGDWEWFILDSSGKITVDADGNPNRGGGDFKACAGCHTAAATDFVFSK